MDKGIQAARLADQIRDYLAVWANQDLPGYLFSFTQVTLSPDFSKAIVWVEVLIPDHADTIISKLQKKLPYYQRKLGQELGKRSCPRIQVALDTRIEDEERLSQLLK